MKAVAQVLRGFFVTPPVKGTDYEKRYVKRPLSRQDVLKLMAANKISPAQARAVLAKQP
jgi:hypothetical protein